MDFAFKPSDRGLAMSLDEQTQTCLDSGFLGSSAAAPHRLAHQTVINFDVCPHGRRLSMCKYLMIM
jgi:hypothetical protein